MNLAHDVTNGESTIPTRVVASLRQKLGAHRMDLWFGADAKWSVVGNNTVGVEVSSQFVADCVSRMFRNELVQAIEEVAGDGYGYRVFVGKIPASMSALDSAVKRSSHAPDSSPRVPSLRGDHPPYAQEQNDQRDVPTVQPTLDSNRKAREESRGLDRAATLRLHREAVKSDPVPSPIGGPKSNLPSIQSSHQSSHHDALSTVERLSELRRENERRWDDFIQGDHNRLAYTAATMVLEKPGQITPLFLHGPHGSGKSHLAIGLAHKLRTTYKMRRVLVLTGEQFTIEFTESARGGGFANFRRKYRDVDVLVIDDLQFCLGKSATLAELRNTIDMLLRERKQIILVADRSLNELSGLSADLHARLAGGMTCGIEPVDVGTRAKLLEQLCSKHGVDLPNATIHELAAQAAGDARVLQGVVHRLVAQQRMVGGAITHDQAIRCTLDLLRASQPVVRMSDIEKVVCDAFGLEEKALRGKTKCQQVSQPRMLAMFLARKYTRSALSEIGEYFGNRQHSTVISAQKKVESWLGEDELIQCGRGKLAVKEIVKNLESSLRVG
ncbi:DnaA ATPase domain-containing protein [Pirellulaceae bacterium SH467]|jgi:chromosomal replication initiator protein